MSYALEHFVAASFIRQFEWDARRDGYFDDADMLREIADALDSGNTAQMRMTTRRFWRERKRWA